MSKEVVRENISADPVRSPDAKARKGMIGAQEPLGAYFWAYWCPQNTHESEGRLDYSGKAKPHIYMGFKRIGMVGYSGFEPLTSSMSRDCPNRIK